MKRLCDKGIFQNTKGTVTSRISRRDFYALQSEKFVEEAFDGLPAGLSGRVHGPQGPHADEVAQLRRLVAEYEEEA